MMSPEECSYTFGGVDEGKFGEPMFWIGLYVAAASVICTIAIAIDIIRSFDWKKNWIPSKYFTFNAATLTILGLAVKISNDVNGNMPGLLDQLAKLSGIFLICVAMTHAMPSLGVMDGGELLSNMIALGILVVATSINIWFQIYTKLIHGFAIHNIIYTVTMLLIYSILVSHSLSVGTIKRIMEKQYASKHQQILSELSPHPNTINGRRDITTTLTTEKLKEYLYKYWFLALTSSPDYILRTSGLSLACTGLCGILFLILLLSLFTSAQIRIKGCHVNSDYKWSTGLVLGVQLSAALAGGIISLFRMQKSKVNYCSISVKKYRLEQLEKWKRDPLLFDGGHGAARSVAYHARNVAVDGLICFKKIVIVLSHLLALIVRLLWWLLSRCLCVLCFLCKRKSPVPPNALKEPLGEYVLSLDGPEDLKNGAEDSKDDTVGTWKHLPYDWLERGQSRSPKELQSLLQKLTSPSSSPGIRLLMVPEMMSSNDQEGLEDCWSLHLATLSCIAYLAVDGVMDRHNTSKPLIRAVNEAFRYTMLVDENVVGASKKVRKTAKMVLERLQYQHKWLDRNLGKLRANGKSIEDAVRDLRDKATSDAAKKTVLVTEWSYDAVARGSMDRITEALLRSGTPLSFERLEREVTGVAATCLAKLPLAIFWELSKGKYGYREEHVRFAAHVIGETERLHDIVSNVTGNIDP